MSEIFLYWFSMPFGVCLLQGFIFNRRMYFAVQGKLVSSALSWADPPVLMEEITNGYLSGSVVSSAMSTV